MAPAEHAFIGPQLRREDGLHQTGLGAHKRHEVFTVLLALNVEYGLGLSYGEFGEFF